MLYASSLWFFNDHDWKNCIELTWAWKLYKVDQFHWMCFHWSVCEWSWSWRCVHLLLRTLCLLLASTITLFRQTKERKDLQTSKTSLSFPRKWSQTKIYNFNLAYSNEVKHFWNLVEIICPSCSIKSDCKKLGSLVEVTPMPLRKIFGKNKIEICVSWFLICG